MQMFSAAAEPAKITHDMAETDMEFHPVAALFPMMPEDDLLALRSDIRENGLIDEIFVAEGKIADGRNRYNACIAENVKPRYRYWDNTGDLLSIVVSLNLKRRHLSESQRAMVAGKFANMQRGRQSSNTATAVFVSQDAASKLLNVSQDSISRAVKVQRDGVPELVEKVEAGEISVTKAAAISSLSKPKQKRLIKRGRKAANSILKKLQTRSVRKAYRLGCLDCDPNARATKESVSALMQRLARKHPAFAWCFNDVAEELESTELSDETRANYGRVLEAIDLGYQTSDTISAKTGIDREHLNHTLALMIDYKMIEPKKEIKKTDAARGATKTIYQRVEHFDDDGELTYELFDEEPDGDLNDDLFEHL